ncbi:hypothetical protein CVT24_008974 [Panaeolus cyanescens]|uniref:LysM domain-containing protein n=1 Tax=Panaeolus cyanescens TaxID=181874 RepID=A0A409YAP6_9AGAR|nr:hypothetical protein CVT24_008974 [Panaeolus cyanescens]
MFSKLITVAVIAASVQTAFAACTRSYTVKEGDYCDKISATQGVSTFQLAAVNAGTINDECTNLLPGQELCLGNTGEDCTTTYTVVADDTCSGIAEAAGLNSTILFLNNPQINSECDNIYIGEVGFRFVLCTSKTVQVPPVPSNGVVIPVRGPPAKPVNHPVPVTTVSPTPSPTPAPAAPQPNNLGSNDDDDDDLPFCDELDD